MIIRIVILYNVNVYMKIQILQKYVCLDHDKSEDYLILIEVQQNAPKHTYLVKIPNNHSYRGLGFTYYAFSKN